MKRRCSKCHKGFFTKKQTLQLCPKCEKLDDKEKLNERIETTLRMYK